MLTLDQVKAKSSKRLIGLHPVVLAAAAALIERCYVRGVNIIITQGLRTIAEQDALYAQGRTNPGNIVTNAKGGSSYHNFGLAVDFALLLPDGRSVSWDMNRDYNSNNVKDWIEVVDEAKKLGLEWGGDWTSFKDYPHFQMTFGLTLKQLRAGKQPTKAQTAAAYAVIDKLQGEGEEEMTTSEKEAFEALKETVASQAKQIAALEGKSNMAVIPVWALPACEAAKAAGLLDTTANGSYDFYRMVTILHRVGAFKK
ncbi:M15 family metallopeptidase [Paenibacillus albidus]|uniref:M15 family metallopeptidase n=1 Tax=Paenibacillus albidus TaxID=2041023 RepID=UPI001BE8A0D6|nr:M15 family metallopeptidase [Paenibacillus albidus]MBT2287966.1 M15 family metallopeptidase [Paenibacillus albidus]